MSIEKISLWCPSVLHLVHHNSSWTYFPCSMSWSCSVRLSSCDWIPIIPALIYPIDEDSRFNAISRAYVHDTIFCCINGTRMHGNNASMNHSLCCTSNISKLTLALVHVINFATEKTWQYPRISVDIATSKCFFLPWQLFRRNSDDP